jgi:glycosyltransferase involved in cell wall biosynthesis
MAKAYSAMDVLTNVSTGEGFGIPIVEAQACGTPVIVGGWTSMRELCFSGRMVDRKDAAPWYTSLGAYQFLPRFEAIAEQYFEEYEHPSSKEKAREGALPYDADLVTETYWKEALDKIAEDIGEGDKLELVQF